jgi:hypothetical protein
MFVSVTRRLVALLWLINEFTKEPPWPAAAGLAFATYCLLMNGYPQVTRDFRFSGFVWSFPLAHWQQIGETRRRGKRD